jgi:hypothetical protein
LFRYGRFATDQFQARRILKLAALLLNAEIEGLLLELATASGELFDRGFTEFFDFHDWVRGWMFSVRRRLFMERLTSDEAHAQTHFIGCKAAGLTCGGFVHAGNFKKHVPREDHRDPELRGAFAFAHSDFRWTLCDWLVREDAAEDLAFALEVTGDRDTAGFDVVVLDPAALKRLEAEIAEVELVAAGGDATAIAALLFAIFYSAG